MLLLRKNMDKMIKWILSHLWSLSARISISSIKRSPNKAVIGMHRSKPRLLKLQLQPKKIWSLSLHFSRRVKCQPMPNRIWSSSMGNKSVKGIMFSLLKGTQNFHLPRHRLYVTPINDALMRLRNPSLALMTSKIVKMIYDITQLVSKAELVWVVYSTVVRHYSVPRPVMVRPGMSLLWASTSCPQVASWIIK